MNIQINGSNRVSDSIISREVQSNLDRSRSVITNVRTDLAINRREQKRGYIFPEGWTTYFHCIWKEDANTRDVTRQYYQGSRDYRVQQLIQEDNALP